MGFLMGIGNGNFYSVFDAVWPKKKKNLLRKFSPFETPYRPPLKVLISVDHFWPARCPLRPLEIEKYNNMVKIF